MVKLNILVAEDSVRLYGNREFFQYLQRQIDHLIECPKDGYCEFQTVSLASQRPDLVEKPEMAIHRMPEGAESYDNAVEIQPDDFDVILMTVEDTDLRRPMCED